MAIRAYGKSVKSYTAWQSSTEYSLQDFRVPTVDNGLCYECTQAGTSDILTEPEWPDVPGHTVNDGTVVWTCRDKEEQANPLTVILNMGETGGYSLKDIWVRSVSGEEEAEFVVYGSYDGVNWRRVDEFCVPQAGRDHRHKGLQNAYSNIKVSTDASFVNEIEIVASPT